MAKPPQVAVPIKLLYTFENTIVRLIYYLCPKIKRSLFRINEEYFSHKAVYRYILTTFIPLFLMTFAICLFLVLMQFLWKYVEDMVGKGLGLDVIGEMFLCRPESYSHGIAFGHFVGFANGLRI